MPHLNTPPQIYVTVWEDLHNTAQMFTQRKKALLLFSLLFCCHCHQVVETLCYGKGSNISVTRLRYSANHNTLVSWPIRAHRTFQNNELCKNRHVSERRGREEQQYCCQSSVVCVMCSRLMCPYLVCFLSSSSVIMSLSMFQPCLCDYVLITLCI